MYDNYRSIVLSLNINSESIVIMIYYTLKRCEAGDVRWCESLIGGSSKDKDEDGCLYPPDTGTDGRSSRKCATITGADDSSAGSPAPNGPEVSTSHLAPPNRPPVDYCLQSRREGKVLLLHRQQINISCF